ncbi:MAG TPA: proteasome-activating nucleotidase [Methanocorpusculum sp.]|nr:proteasome-activating nucleotidase [Methanocorpusculum sp.]
MTDNKEIDSDVKYPADITVSPSSAIPGDEQKPANELAELRKTNIALETRNFELRESVRQARLHLAAAESERDQYRREAQKYKTELKQVRASPMVVGTIEQLLDEGRVLIRSTTGPSFVSQVLDSIDRDELSVGAQCALHPQSFTLLEILPPRVDAQVHAMEIDTAPSVSYEDIGGLKKQMQLLRESIELPLTQPELFEKAGVEPPKGVLMYGPPGTGKTMLAKAIAHATNATFIRVVGSELVQKYIGEGARLVRELFTLARSKAPAIVFIDEIDAVGAARSSDTYSAGDHEVGRTLMQLLAELDGFNPRGNVKIIAATNRIDILDTALLRPGRFDRIVEFPLPEAAERETILRLHTRKMNLAKDVALSVLASDENTAGFNGAELMALTIEAGMTAIRDTRSLIRMADFTAALDVVRDGRNTGEKRPEIPLGVYQ